MTGIDLIAGVARGRGALDGAGAGVGAGRMATLTAAGRWMTALAVTRCGADAVGE